jgi:hypothetical protein
MSFPFASPALELMLQLPIRAAYNVPGHRRVRGRHGILRRVRRTDINPGIRRNPRHSTRMKGPSYEQGTRLQAAAGLHHLMANHWHVLVNNSSPWHRRGAAYPLRPV